jgi:O-Antigen ligase
MSEMLPLQRSSLLLDVLFGATIASLFSGIHHSFGSVKVQLSDLIALATIFLAVLKGFSAPRVSRLVLLVLLAYLLDYLTSALFVKMSMAAVKTVQFALAFSFLFAVFGYYRTHSSDRLLIVSTILMMVILVANIGWHILHGQLVGWKRLNEPKTIFILMPLMLILLFDRFPRFWRLPRGLCAVLLSVAIIFLSGERKAYIFAPLALLIWTEPRKIWRYAILPIAAIPLLWIAGSVDQTGYLHRQLTSLQVLISGNSTQEMSDSQLMDVNRPTTLSNAERIFTNRRAAAEWRKRPMLGIGTDAFQLQMREDTSIPDEFRLGIHGEFFRALYENGIVGLQLYIAVWISAFASLAMMWLPVSGAGGASLNKIKLLSLVMLLIYSSFESEKEVMAFALCCLPFVLGLLPSAESSERLGSVDRRSCTRPNLVA